MRTGSTLSDSLTAVARSINSTLTRMAPMSRSGKRSTPACWPIRPSLVGGHDAHCAPCGNDEGPGFLRGLRLQCGRYWDRTSDLFRVREARYRCANRPGELVGIAVLSGGGDGIRTRVDGFAGRCLAS